MFNIKLSQRDIETLLLGIVAICMLTFFIYSHIRHYHELDTYTTYTKGTIIEVKWRKKAFVNYNFDVDGKVYTGSSTYAIGHIAPKIGEVYLVKYSSHDPTFNTMIMNYEDAIRNKSAKIFRYHSNDKQRIEEALDKNPNIEVENLAKINGDNSKVESLSSAKMHRTDVHNGNNFNK